MKNCGGLLLFVVYLRLWFFCRTTTKHFVVFFSVGEIWLDVDSSISVYGNLNESTLKLAAQLPITAHWRGNLRLVSQSMQFPVALAQVWMSHLHQSAQNFTLHFIQFAVFLFNLYYTLSPSRLLLGKKMSCCLAHGQGQSCAAHLEFRVGWMRPLMNSANNCEYMRVSYFTGITSAFFMLRYNMYILFSPFVAVLHYLHCLYIPAVCVCVWM